MDDLDIRWFGADVAADMWEYTKIHAFLPCCERCDDAQLHERHGMEKWEAISRERTRYPVFAA